MPFISDVKIDIYNSLGEIVTNLTNESFSAGFHEISWNAGDLAGGIYFLRMISISPSINKKYTETRKLVLLK